MDDKLIQQWLDAFYNGATTEEEERALKAFFLDNKDVPEHWADEQRVFRAIVSEAMVDVPEGFAERLEKSVDEHIARRKSVSLRSIGYWVASIAAVGLICIGLFMNEVSYPVQDDNLIADTYKNPEEAAIAAQKALILISSNLNKGMKQLDMASSEMNNVNRILEEQLNNK